MTLTELGNVKPGRSVGNIRHGSGQLIDTDITRAIVPESSALADKDTKVYVATDNAGKANVAIGLANIHNGEADLGIETFDGEDLNDPGFAQKLVIEVMHQSGVELANLDPEVAAISEETLPQVGFQADASGEAYTFSLAA